MAKKVTGVVKLQIPAGAANPAPPVGPALGSAGVNIMQFCKEFNAKTAKDSGLVIPVIITVYQDRSFSLQFKSPPASVLLKKEAGLAKGGGHHGLQNGRQVGEDGAKADGQQQGRLVFLLDGQVDQDAGDDKHDQALHTFHGEEEQYAGKQLRQNLLHGSGRPF